jgi:hypothetical protein
MAPHVEARLAAGPTIKTPTGTECLEKPPGLLRRSQRPRLDA